VNGKGRELSGGRSIGRLSSGGVVQLEVRLEGGLCGLILGLSGGDGKRQVTTALAKGGAKEKRRNAEACLCEEEIVREMERGVAEKCFGKGEKKIQFLTHVFDKFSKQNKTSKKTTKTQKKSFLIYLHRF